MFGLMPLATVRVGTGAPPPPPPPPDVAPAFTSDPGTSVYVGSTYTYTPTVTGNPTPTLSPSALPAWLTWSGGTLSGIAPLSAASVYGPGNEALYIDAVNGVAPNARQTWNLAIAVPEPTGALRVWDGDTRPGYDFSSPTYIGYPYEVYPGLRAIAIDCAIPGAVESFVLFGLTAGAIAGFTVSAVDGTTTNYMVDLNIGGAALDTGIANFTPIAAALVICTDGALCVVKSATTTWTHLLELADIPGGVINPNAIRVDSSVDGSDNPLQAFELWTGGALASSAAYPSSLIIDWMTAAVAP